LLIDFGFKVRWLDRFARKYNKLILNTQKLFKALFHSKNEDHQLSDSQITRYETAVNKAISSKRYFSKFRRKYIYRQILEHVDPVMGTNYLEKILDLDQEIIDKISALKSNDSVGGPLKFNYPVVGDMCPSTLRYISVAAELKSLFGPLSGFKVAEIGIGYGGQFRILDCMFDMDQYFLFDLESVQNLTLKYLNNFKIKSDIFAITDISKFDSEIDLLISNYAFSEIPYRLQSSYLQRVILKSKRGYMIMNSGKTNFSGRSAGKHSVEDLLNIIPNARISEENPNTGVDNYLLTWGEV